MDLRLLLNNDDETNAVDVPMDVQPKHQPKLRSGKWTRQEEKYAATLIKYFVEGALDIPRHVSLRNLLASKLHCSLIRVSDKMTHGTLGRTAIAKKLGLLRYFPSKSLSEAYRSGVAYELRQLELSFRRSEGLPEDEELGSLSVSNQSQSDSDGDSDSEPVRVGSWTHEEERYAGALIDAFFNGLVCAREGMTLRGFLAHRLRCSPMRVSKKLAKGKLAGLPIPKRRGSALYKYQPHILRSDIDRMELQLEQLHRDCFTSAPPPPEQDTLPSRLHHLEHRDYPSLAGRSTYSSPTAVHERTYYSSPTAVHERTYSSSSTYSISSVHDGHGLRREQSEDAVFAPTKSIDWGGREHNVAPFHSTPSYPSAAYNVTNYYN